MNGNQIKIHRAGNGYTIKLMSGRKVVASGLAPDAEVLLDKIAAIVVGNEASVLTMQRIGTPSGGFIYRTRSGRRGLASIRGKV